jgi:hypothetical protein
MVRIAVTGHQRLDDASWWPWVEAEIDRVLRDVPKPLTGLTSLAVGADQVFAEAVLRNGGALVVVLPFARYALTFDEGPERKRFQRLVACASSVEVLDAKGKQEEAYLSAGKRVVDESDWVIAIWDGKPAAGLGGTADIVGYAVSRGKRVIHMNPSLGTITLIGAVA